MGPDRPISFQTVRDFASRSPVSHGDHLTVPATAECKVSASSCGAALAWFLADVAALELSTTSQPPKPTDEEAAHAMKAAAA